MNELIDLLQNQELVWQGTANIQSKSGLSTCYRELDDELSGGFVKNGVTEILSPVGIGELRLLLPSLQEAKSEDRLTAFIAPRGLITPEAIVAQGYDLNNVLVIYPSDQKDTLWAAEQCLRGGTCHSVLLWTEQAFEIHQIKRLQVACDTGNAKTFILRTERAESLSLPFDLSLSLSAHHQGVTAKINKRKRGWPSAKFPINMSTQWPSLTVQPVPDNLVHFPKVKIG